MEDFDKTLKLDAIRIDTETGQPVPLARAEAASSVEESAPTESGGAAPTSADEANADTLDPAYQIAFDVLARRKKMRAEQHENEPARPNEPPAQAAPQNTAQVPAQEPDDDTAPEKTTKKQREKPPHRSAKETDNAKPDAIKPEKKPKKKKEKLEKPAKKRPGILTVLVIFLKILLLVPVPLFMIWVNYTVDRTGLFHGDRFEREVALSLLAGQSVAGYEQMDERQITALYVQNMTQSPATIALGSSRILQMSESMVDDAGGFYNCGMIGADFMDVLGTYYLFEKADKLPENIIIGLDPWLLSGGDEAVDYRSDKNLYNEFLTEALGIDAPYEKPDTAQIWQALVDPSYFQGNVAYYFRDQSSERHPAPVQGDLYGQSTEVKMPDGTVLYTANFRNADPYDVMVRARSDAMSFLRMNDYLAPDPVLCQIFDAFIRHLQEKGINVIFVMVPFHPLVYTRACDQADKFPGFWMTEDWFASYAKTNDIPLYGSYNPRVMNCFDEDYYDGMHIRAEALAQIVPSMPEIEAQQTAGRAGSPWLSGGPRVSQTVAHRLVKDKYVITAPTVLEFSEVTTINGQSCYVFHYLASDSPGATRLASYAVTQDEGIVLRLDTTSDTWVVDLVFPE